MQQVQRLLFAFKAILNSFISFKEQPEKGFFALKQLVITCNLFFCYPKQQVHSLKQGFR